jgi:hypothetical protein
LLTAQGSKQSQCEVTGNYSYNAAATAREMCDKALESPATVKKDCDIVCGNCNNSGYLSPGSICNCAVGSVVERKKAIARLVHPKKHTYDEFDEYWQNLDNDSTNIELEVELMITADIVEDIILGLTGDVLSDGSWYTLLDHLSAQT